MEKVYIRQQKYKFVVFVEVNGLVERQYSYSKLEEAQERARRLCDFLDLKPIQSNYTKIEKS